MKELQCTIMFILIKGCLEIAFQTVNVLHTFVSEWDFASQLLKHLGRWKFCGLTHSCGRAEDECGRGCFHRIDKSSHPPWIHSHSRYGAVKLTLRGSVTAEKMRQPRKIGFFFWTTMGYLGKQKFGQLSQDGPRLYQMFLSGSVS